MSEISDGSAMYERTAQPPLSSDMVFHAQQAAEKAMKGFLTWHDRPFRKTHNLSEAPPKDWPDYVDRVQSDPDVELTKTVL